MLRFISILLLTLGAVIGAMTATAEQLVQIYRAEALVSSQAVAQRNAALEQSLAEVIVRVTGDKAALENPTIRQALRQAQNYLYEFSYASTDEQVLVEDRMVPATRLILKYSAQAIEKLLRDAQLPLWPANRPKLLVWQVMRDETGSLMRVPDEASRKALYDEAGLRGVPLLLPMQDLEDNLALSMDDLWQMNEEAIRNASLRYKPDAILVGRYSQGVGGLWQAHWELLHAAGKQVFELQSVDVPDLFTQAIDASADYFAQKYAIVPREEGPDTIIMRVSEVGDFATYKKVERYLAGLAMVSQVDVVMAERNNLLVRLHTEGDLQLLLSTLELGKKLYPVVSDSLPLNVVQPFEPESAAPPVETNTETDNAQATSGSTMAIQSGPTLTRGTMTNPLVYVWRK